LFPPCSRRRGLPLRGGARLSWSRRQPPRRVAVEEACNPFAISSRIDLSAAVVLGAGDEPEFLRLARLVEKTASDFGADVIVPLAVKHQQRARTDPLGGPLDVGIVPPETPLRAHAPGPAGELEHPDGHVLPEQLRADIDLRPAQDVSKHRTPRRKSSVSH